MKISALVVHLNVFQQLLELVSYNATDHFSIMLKELIKYCVNPGVHIFKTTRRIAYKITTFAKCHTY